ncbi:unnamed protein product [Coffea canephora]|uniref:Uncharacterized protein n=1 Tax=Coffea canephora TaxID=49390 RepID=A0A068UIB6_COFCA|nr:unnamed protein product [Coffea canephora]
MPQVKACGSDKTTEIAWQCRGLPLAIVAVAGLLKMTEMSRNSWKKIANSLSSQVLNDPEAQCRSVLELSYQYLPEYLKPCFLYMGVLGKNKDILVSKLIQLWLAEGLIPKTQTKSFEDLAEDFLMELIDKSLVIISKRRSNGKVKACRLHSFMLDFCQSKAKEANFVELVTSLKQNHFLESRPSGLGTRSLVFLASTDSKTRRPCDISLILHNFKLLKVLDFECMDMASFPVEIGLLIHLRYLAVGGYVTSIPKSLGNLRKLETLIVKGLSALDFLTHLESLKIFYFGTPLNDGKFNLPSNLKKLTLSDFRLPWSHISAIGSLPNLEVLKFLGLDTLDIVRWNASYDHLPTLERLVLQNCNDLKKISLDLVDVPSLQMIEVNYCAQSVEESANRIRDKCRDVGNYEIKVFIRSQQDEHDLDPVIIRNMLSGWKDIPRNLKKLTLTDFHLPWSHISAIGRLPNLEVLKLQSDAFEGQTWEMKEGESPRLGFLGLDTLDIVRWNASCDHLPTLERLVLQNCNDLRIFRLILSIYFHCK